MDGIMKPGADNGTFDKVWLDECEDMPFYELKWDCSTPNQVVFIDKDGVVNIGVDFVADTRKGFAEFLDKKFDELMFEYLISLPSDATPPMSLGEALSIIQNDTSDEAPWQRKERLERELVEKNRKSREEIKRILGQ